MLIKGRINNIGSDVIKESWDVCTHCDKQAVTHDIKCRLVYYLENLNAEDLRLIIISCKHANNQTELRRILALCVQFHGKDAVREMLEDIV